METNETFGVALPRYKGHKTVSALEIAEVRPAEKRHAWESRNYQLVPSDTRFDPIDVTHEWYVKHSPVAGGYFVIYDDGYTSFSPKKAFESGYTLVDTTNAANPEPSAPVAGAAVDPMPVAAGSVATEIPQPVVATGSASTDTPPPDTRDDSAAETPPAGDAQATGADLVQTESHTDDASAGAGDAGTGAQSESAS